mgnify:CR=1 FL=1
MGTFLITSPLLPVLATVLLGLISAVSLKSAATFNELNLLMLFFFGLAIATNFIRFLIWGIVHKKHPISLSYPLASIFFPLILLVGHFYYGDPITTTKIIGVIFIMLGVAILISSESKKNATP